MAYLPIEHYGIIGNMRSAALVGTNGSIDWWCFPFFDSPSVFCGILDDVRGGKFVISPLRDGVRNRQLYFPETNILVTRFLSKEGVGEIEDFMPVALTTGFDTSDQIVRRVTVTRGRMTFRMECRPRFDYARGKHTGHRVGSGVRFQGDELGLFLASDVPLSLNENDAVADFTLEAGESAVFVLRQASNGCSEECPSPEHTEMLFEKTVDYWHNWLSRCTYQGRWREKVYRSALALKLMTFAPTGAIVASPTLGLPEEIGGVRNWDYRYTWIRDAAFTLYGLMRIGFTDEAAAFMNWLDTRWHEAGLGQPMQIVYGIDGRRDLTESELDHLDGYRGSKPVRIGNGAYDQLQLDIYGELLDSVYLFNKHHAPISYDSWNYLRRLVDWVCDNWHRRDEGIWEVRGERQHFVFSKLMCWVALDRGLRLADKRSFPCDRTRWLSVRDRIYEEIMTRGWNHERQSFVQAYDSDHLDASNLIMPLVFFTSPNDPRMLKTIEAIRRPPSEGGLSFDSLVHRYSDEFDDGLAGGEGTFNMCTFWLVEALTRAGRVNPPLLNEARLLFERMLGYANHLGLYAEETGPNGEALGNFPQAFTHLALISAAFNLDRTLGKGL